MEWRGGKGRRRGEEGRGGEGRGGEGRRGGGEGRGGEGRRGGGEGRRGGEEGRGGEERRRGEGRRGGEGRGVGGKYCDYVDGGASNLHQVRLTVCCHVECSLVWLRAALRSASLDTNSSVSYRRVSLQQWTRGRVDEGEGRGSLCGEGDEA